MQFNVRTLDGIARVIEEYPAVVINFTAPSWCIPCQRLAPHFEALASQLENVAFVKVDVDLAIHDVVEDFQVQGVPTLMLYLDGKYVTHLAGRNVLALTNEINSYLD